jgi:hypothetical protein
MSALNRAPVAVLEELTCDPWMLTRGEKMPNLDLTCDTSSPERVHGGIDRSSSRCAARSIRKIYSQNSIVAADTISRRGYSGVREIASVAQSTVRSWEIHITTPPPEENSS